MQPRQVDYFEIVLKHQNNSFYEIKIVMQDYRLIE